MIDLRSDTVTRPSPAMREAMANAEVGDDVFGEDPTVNSLQKRMAEMFGFGDALFVPSGTMGNEVCLAAHTRRGDEVIVDSDSHIFIYETAGPSLLANIQLMPVAGKRGVPGEEELMRAFRPDVYYLPRTALICLENTHGRSAGAVVPIAEIGRVSAFAHERKVPLHLDGARIWNASVASGTPLTEYSRYVDSMSVCFSKGLGAPVGSMILGNSEFITRCLKYRKIFGGGMRQAGILAAAAHYALDHNIERLAEDHAKAAMLAEALGSFRQIRVRREEVETNMVIAEISGTGRSQSEVLRLLKEQGVLLTPERQSSIRAVTHLDVSMEEVKEAIAVFRRLFH
jgi:threonine aldolase